MRPKERRDSGQSDFFKARLDQIIDMGHPLAKLVSTVGWRFLEERFGAVYSDKPGQPPLPTRLMAGFRSSSTRTICRTRTSARWVENPYFQLFCDGMDGPGASAMLALYGLTSEGIKYVHHRNHWAGYREERVSGSWRRGRRRSCAQEADKAPSISPARSAASPTPSNATCAGARPSSPSSVTPRATTVWDATSSKASKATPPTPCSPPPAATSAESSPGSPPFGARSSWPSSPTRSTPQSTRSAATPDRSNNPLRRMQPTSWATGNLVGNVYFGSSINSVT